MGRASRRGRVKARGERRIRWNEERFLTSQAGAFVPQNHPGRKRGAGASAEERASACSVRSRSSIRDTKCANDSLSNAAAGERLALEPRPMPGSKLYPILGVRTAQVFTVSLSWVRPKANGGRPGHVSHPLQLPPVSTRSPGTADGASGALRALG